MRQQHYRFAHQVLMSAVLRDPSAWWAAAAAQGNTMLQQAWAAAGEGLGPENHADGSSLVITPMYPAPGVEALLITLPPPQAPTECHYVALVRAGGQPPRYFVAERGIEGEGGVQRAYWAEWRQPPGGGIMRIRGADLPAISPEAFLAAAAAECSAAPPGPQAAPWPGPQGPPLPGVRPATSGKINRVGLFLGAGCFTLVLFVLSIGGYLLYQEEGRGLHVPDTEVASVVVDPDKPFKIQFTWDGTGYAFNNVWLVVDEGTTSGSNFKVTGSVACSRGSRAQTVDVGLTGYGAHNVERTGGNGFSAWLYLMDEYERSSSRPIECSGTIAPTAGQWTKARIVVTQRQRPSDWFAN
ncbi:hypothetical protein [Polyangium sp. y55x31]|uniref:hypothetical protein n=1 Tax=Polyangium sp. y55x31 TaxID=3042688 RepID=UPI00248321D0|nr:hypothetical protein [Polyangium sp. y55x31]MDI1480189.1 hypothetical protein [Polyangium sp. y55x31]